MSFYHPDDIPEDMKEFFEPAPQLGLEETPEAFVTNLVEVFGLVRELLADDGTLWLNLGDSYAANRTYQVPSTKGGAKHSYGQSVGGKGSVIPDGLKQKDLIGIPWRVAFALQADGWYLRQDIIWHKPNPMPESVTDRCTKAHEYIFLLSKSPKYFYDAEAVKEPAVCGANGSQFHTGNTGEHQMGRAQKVRPSKERGEFGGKNTIPGKEGFRAVVDMRNRRSVWTVSTRPYKGAHFATFPKQLITPCVLAGSRSAGKRCDCDHVINSPTGSISEADPSMIVGRAGMSRARNDGEGTRPITKREQRHHAVEMKNSPHKEEMRAICGGAYAHYIRTDNAGARPLPSTILEDFKSRGWITEAPPCTCPVCDADIVFDPFMGSGTTAEVALENGRQYLGCELNQEYGALQQKRLDGLQHQLLPRTK